MNVQKSYFKKALVMLMAVMMVFTMMPSMAWADGDTGTGTTEITSIKLNKAELDLMLNATERLAAEVSPEGVTEDIIWESSDASVATVDQGTVKALKVGQAIVTAKNAEGTVSGSCQVTVWDSCGTTPSTAKWTVKNNGATLSIAGAGAIADSASAMKQPWKDVRTNITRIEIGKDITKIGAFSFAMFSKLATVEIAEPSRLTCIGASAFMGTSKLTSITLPSSLTQITDTNIASKEIHFKGTASQWENLNYTGKKDVYVLDVNGQEVKYEPDPYNGKCGDSATWNFNKESGVLTISGTGAMKDYTAASNAPWYQHKSSITSVTIESGITSVGNYAFAEYSNLKTVTLPETVENIGISSFSNNSALSDIDLKGVSNFEKGAFDGCIKLKTLQLAAAQNIGEQAFTNCSGLTKVTLGTIDNQVSKIGKRAFTRCTSLTSVDFKNVKEIGEYAFESSSLTEADLSGIEIIGQNAFKDSKNLTQVTFDSKLTTIGERAFSGIGITALNIPGTVSSLGNYAFDNCTQLKTVTIASGVASIPKGCFSNNSVLEKVKIPQSVGSVGEYAFYNCGLKSVDYEGTDEQWKNVSVAENNDSLVKLMGKTVISVTGVSLNKESILLTLGGAAETLTAVVMPENADNIAVIWKSENEEVAIVDKDGMVTAKGIGTTTITATTVDGNFQATCSVTVSNPEVKLDLTNFVFVADNASVKDERYQCGNLSIAKQEDGSYCLTAPTYIVGTSTSKATLRIVAPKDFNTPYTVSYTVFDPSSGDSKGEKTIHSENGIVTLEDYYNPRGKIDSSRYDPTYGFFKNLEFSELVFSTEGNIA